MSRGGTPGKQGHGSGAGIHHKLQVLAHRLAVAQIVIALQQAVEETFLRGSSNLAEHKRWQISQSALKRGLIQRYRLRSRPHDERVRRPPPNRGQLNVSGSP